MLVHKPPIRELGEQVLVYATAELDLANRTEDERFTHFSDYATTLADYPCSFKTIPLIVVPDELSLDLQVESYLTRDSISFRVARFADLATRGKKLLKQNS